MEEVKEIVENVQDVVETVQEVAEEIPVTPTVIPDYLPTAKKPEGLNGKVIAGVAIGTTAVVGLIAAGAHFLKKRKAKKAEEEELDDWEDEEIILADEEPEDSEPDLEVVSDSKGKESKK